MKTLFAILFTLCALTVVGQKHEKIIADEMRPGGSVTPGSVQLSTGTAVENLSVEYPITLTPAQVKHLAEFSDEKKAELIRKFDEAKTQTLINYIEADPKQPDITKVIGYDIKDGKLILKLKK